MTRRRRRSTIALEGFLAFEWARIRDAYDGLLEHLAVASVFCMQRMQLRLAWEL
jgi:hypothetical protein